MTTPIPASWKPISSAPKDGTDILLTNGAHVSCGHWHYDEGGTTEYRDLDGRYIGQDDRDGFAGWLDWMGGMTPNPTHWMPLPAAPGYPASVAPGDAQDEQPKRNGCGSVSFKLSDGSAVSCDWSTHEWELSIPATRHERDIAFKELLQEIGRLRASVAAPAAGDARLPALNIEAAAKAMAECMDYPWAHMPEQGRGTMREHAQTVIRAASQQQEG